MIIVLFLIGLITALIGSIAGLGGGVILVPVLLFLGEHFYSFEWVSPQSIVGISLVVMIFTGMSSAVSYMKHDRVDKKAGATFLIGSLPGGVLGSWLNQFLQTEFFSLMFGTVMIIVSLLFFLPRTQQGSSLFKKGKIREKRVGGITYSYQFPFIVGFVLSLIVGILSGLLGIGGGSLMVPAMILLFQFPPHIATATSMFMIFFTSMLSSATHIYLGHVNWEYVIYFIPGAYIGGTLGALINRRLKGQAVEWFLRFLLILIGIRLIWQGMG